MRCNIKSHLIALLLLIHSAPSPAATPTTYPADSIVFDRVLSSGQHVQVVRHITKAPPPPYRDSQIDFGWKLPLPPACPHGLSELLLRPVSSLICDSFFVLDNGGKHEIFHIERLTPAPPVPVTQTRPIRTDGRDTFTDSGTTNNREPTQPLIRDILIERDFIFIAWEDDLNLHVGVGQISTSPRPRHPPAREIIPYVAVYDLVSWRDSWVDCIASVGSFRGRASAGTLALPVAFKADWSQPSRQKLYRLQWCDDAPGFVAEPLPEANLPALAPPLEDCTALPEVRDIDVAPGYRLSIARTPLPSDDASPVAVLDQGRQLGGPQDQWSYSNPTAEDRYDFWLTQSGRRQQVWSLRHRKFAFLRYGDDDLHVLAARLQGNTLILVYKQRGCSRITTLSRPAEGVVTPMWVEGHTQMLSHDQDLQGFRVTAATIDGDVATAGASIRLKATHANDPPREAVFASWRQHGTFQIAWHNTASTQPALRVLEDSTLLTFALDTKTRMQFAYIPAGKCIMGSASVNEDELCQRREITISKPFYMAVQPVSHAEYRAIIKPQSYFGDRIDTWAQTPLSWTQAQEFCRELAAKTGWKFSLPTEAQWEYAASAGTGILEVTKPHQLPNGSEKVTHPWGLRDMQWDNWQWCSDWYAPWDPPCTIDPRGPATGQRRVVRGGIFEKPNELHARSDRRAGEDPTVANEIRVRLVINQDAD